MNPNGKTPTLHTIDGRQMTVAEIAEMLGVTQRALEVRKSRLHAGYQVSVDMYRANRIGSRHDKCHRHNVHGRWMTVREAAEELGIKPACLINWRCNHRDAQGNKPTLEAAYDQYMRYKTGVQAKHPGNTTARHMVHGRRMTVVEAAERYHVSENYLRKIMSQRKCSLDAAVKRLEARRARRAEKDILNILGF